MTQPNHSPQITQLLSQLRDIHTTDPVGIWPLAFGWWILIFLSLVLFAFAVWRISTYFKKNRWRKQARNELQSLKSLHASCNDNSGELVDCLAQTNQLLRRVYARKQSNREALSSPPKQWLALIQQELPNTVQSDLDTLTSGHYNTHVDRINPETFSDIERWIKQR